MKFVILSGLALISTAPAAIAQTAPAAPAAPAAAAKFSLDTPITVLVADEKAKGVLDTVVPGLTTHEAFEMFKTMTLRELQPYSEGAITDAMLVKVQADLAAIK